MHVSMCTSKYTPCLHFSVHKNEFACDSGVFKACCHGVKQSKVLLTDGHLLEREAPRGGGGRGDRENEDMIQHQDKPVIIGEKSQMATWTVNEPTFE